MYLVFKCLPVQLDYFGWMPNAPVGLQRPPPACRGRCSERSLLDSFPDVKSTVHGLATVYLLSKTPADFVRTHKHEHDVLMCPTLNDQNIINIWIN